jgi:hypothetical protein
MINPIVIDLSVRLPPSPVQVKRKNQKLEIRGIPATDTLEYVMRDAETQSKYYVIHRPTEDVVLSRVRLHIGLENQLIEAQVTSAIRLLDGGTTIIEYVLDQANGELYLPSQLQEESQLRPPYQKSAIKLTEKRGSTDTYKGTTTPLEHLRD